MGDRHGPAGREPGRAPRRRREIVLALMLLFAYGYFVQVPAWNELSRYDLVRALVEDGTTRIDRFHENTGDKSFYDGHYYSDKAPGVAFLGVPVYAFLATVSMSATGEVPSADVAIAALAFVASGLLTAILAVLLLRFLRHAVGDAWALVIAAGYGLGSIAFPFATMLFGHAAAAFFLFAAFYTLWRARSAEGRRRTWLPILAGFLGGWAVLTDLSSALGVMVLLAYALLAGGAVGRWRPQRPAGVLARLLARVDVRTPVLMVAGGLPPAALLLWYDWVSFGSPLSLGYSNLASGGFAAGMGQGILGVTMPRLEVIGDLLVGPRGLLRLAPWFVLVPVGLLAARRRELRAEVLVCFSMVVAFLVFNAGYYLPFGGWTPGPRFLVPALPFAAVLVGLAPARVRPLSALLVGMAVVLMVIATVTMPNAPERFGDPLYELWIPRLASGYLAETLAWRRWGLHGLEALVPLCLGLGLGAMALVLSFRPGRWATRATMVLATALAVLVVAFSLPFPQPAPSPAANGGGSGGYALSIVDVGAVPVAIGTTSEASLWAQIENAGPAAPDTRVRFDVYTPAGERSWSGWHADVDWAPGQRRTMIASWDTTAVEPGDYRLEVTVVPEGSDGPATPYAFAEDSAPIRVRP